jgi:hypothetical protein
MQLEDTGSVEPLLVESSQPASATDSGLLHGGGAERP